jgi:hypothetical protein
MRVARIATASFMIYVSSPRLRKEQAARPPHER